MTYNFRLVHSERMKRAVQACVEAGIGLTAMKTQGGGSINTENETEIELAGRFLKQGFTDKQAKLKAVWENPHIATICSQMPNLTILMANIAAAMNQTKLSSDTHELLQQYARETSSTYCAGCAKLCESCLGGKVPIRDVMRYLMYYHAYDERDRARALYAAIPPHIRSDLPTLDYSTSEAYCPQRLPIGKVMREAGSVLA
jgi:uncharacterized protein